MPLLKEQLVEVLGSASRVKILQCAREQAPDFDVPLRQVEEEVFSRTRTKWATQERANGLFVDAPVLHLREETVEMESEDGV